MCHDIIKVNIFISGLGIRTVTGLSKYLAIAVTFVTV